MQQQVIHAEKHTKIVATLGPATADIHVLTDMVKAGMNMARLNFSHGTHEAHQKSIELVREVMKNLNCTIGIIADLQGPKIRIAGFKTDKVTLKKGGSFILDATLGEKEGDETCVGMHYEALVDDVKSEDFLLLDDGRLKLQVKKVVGKQIHTIIQNDGFLSANKGINLLGGGLSAPALTEKDKEDLSFALSQKVDYIALSFVRNAADIQDAKIIIDQQKSHAGIISKIERAEALHEIQSIIDASDGIMVARGDLAVEIGDERVPAVQKQLIAAAIKSHKPVITATQMMESMVKQVIPTRAEMSDVANAVLDGTDAVMLSEETAMGAHPVLVIEAMARACIGAREYLPTLPVYHEQTDAFFDRIDEAVAMSAIFAANHMDVKAIVALTESGATPLWMSRRQSIAPIYGLSRHHKALGRMTLYRGVFPIYFDVTDYSRGELNKATIRRLEECNLVFEKDRVILTKGDSHGIGGGANAMKILTVGEVV
jgi:pyruvate kinase